MINSKRKKTQIGSNKIPKQLTISIGGYTGSSFCVAKEGTKLRYESYDSGFKLHKTEILNPDEKYWMRFNKTLEVIRIWEWQSEYKNNNICDGTQWNMEIEWDDRKIISSGINNYPADFARFLKAVRKLIDGRKFE